MTRKANNHNFYDPQTKGSSSMHEISSATDYNYILKSLLRNLLYIIYIYVQARIGFISDVLKYVQKLVFTIVKNIISENEKA